MIVVSPHLDDAVFSCGGLLAVARRRGEAATVVTVFSEGHDHERRRTEDRDALALLGATPVHLGLLDAPERLGVARSHGALVEEARVDPSDVATVRASLEAALSSGAGPVYAPLGIGGHVDHLTVHAALRERDDVVFYEDRPYAFVPGAVRARLVTARILLSERSLAEEPDLAEDSGPFALDRAALVLPHLDVFLGRDPASRSRSLAWLASHHAEPRPDGTLVPREAHVRRRAVDHEAARLAARAVSLYASQPRLLPPELPRFERTFDPGGHVVR